MLLLLLSYAATAGFPFGLYYAYNRYRYRNIPKALLKQYNGEVTYLEDHPPVGMTVVEYTLPPETEEQYLKRMKTIHPEAWDTYHKEHLERKMLDKQDLFINKLLLKVRHGELTVEAKEHTMVFSEGTEVWIVNKYYAFGSIHRCEKNKQMCFEYNSGRLSLYTFMTLVDMEMEMKEFSEWKKSHDMYSRTRLSKIKEALGK